MKKIVLLLCSFSAFADDSILDLGEKIFNDTRFSKSKTVSCASCHMIDQSFGEQGMRIYNDFQARTKLAIEINGDKTTLRNTPGLVGIGSKFSRHNFSHHDGELVHRQTYLGNFTGKNMGWAEKGLATKNVVKTLRSNEYREEFMSLPGSWSIDLERLTDDQMIEQMIKVGTYYLFDLDFQTDEQGHYIGSPYDQFLKENGIDRGPRESETNMQYSARIRKEFMQLDNPVYVQKKHFPTLKKSYEFGPKAFEGLKIFFNISKRGMCFNCHVAPLFTDQDFHNVGVTQMEYDSIHGKGAARASETGGTFFL